MEDRDITQDWERRTGAILSTLRFRHGFSVDRCKLWQRESAKYLQKLQTLLGTAYETVDLPTPIHVPEHGSRVVYLSLLEPFRPLQDMFVLELSSNLTLLPAIGLLGEGKMYPSDVVLLWGGDLKVVKTSGAPPIRSLLPLPWDRPNLPVRKQVSLAWDYAVPDDVPTQDVEEEVG